MDKIVTFIIKSFTLIMHKPST